MQCIQAGTHSLDWKLGAFAKHTTKMTRKMVLEKYRKIVPIHGILERANRFMTKETTLTAM